VKSHRRVVVRHLPESATAFRGGWAVVCVDVFRASTTAVTAVATGRRCFPVSSLEEAARVAATLPDPLVAGEQAGDVPASFHANNSPAEFARRGDVRRPLVLLTSAGTPLMRAASGADEVYVASLRNVSAQVRHLAERDGGVAVVGAGTRGAARREDRIACARLATGLVAVGFQPDRTAESEIAEWGDAPIADCASGSSGEFLRRTGQKGDIDFVVSHDDDLDAVFTLVHGEILAVSVVGRLNLSGATAG
jgi:2-phosphosulfolactate phosphatase